MAVHPAAESEGVSCDDVNVDVTCSHVGSIIRVGGHRQHRVDVWLSE